MTPLKKLFGGKDLQLEKLPAEIKPLVEQMRQERAAFEALMLQAEGMAKRAEQLREPVAAVEQRLAALDQLAKHLGDLKLDETKRMADAMGAELAGTRAALTELQKAKGDLPGLLELVKPLAGLPAQAAALDEQMRQVAQRFAQLKAEHEKVTALAADVQNVATRFEALQGRAGSWEKTAEELQRLSKEVPDVKRELSTLNVLAEYVSQKVATLEGQRDTVDRATQRAERLAELAGQVDRQLQEQHENQKFLTMLQKNVDEIKKLHEAALQRTEELEKKGRALDAEMAKLNQDFVSARDALQKSASQFRFEKDGLEALNQRLVEMREALSAAEQKLPMVEEARDGLDAVAADAKRLTDTVRAVGQRVSDLAGVADTAQAVQARVQQLQGLVDDLARRLEATAPASLSQELDERARQLEEARGRVARLETKLADWDALESKVDQSLQLATERRAAVDAIRADLQRLFEVADGTVARVREAAAMQHDIEERRQSLDPVLGKLKDLDRQAETLEQRKKQFQDAEERLSRLDALLIDLQSTLKTVTDQKEFLERVVETAGSLALQTMQAEAAINTLREATEGAKREQRR